MAAAKHNLVIEQGVDFTLEVTLTDSSGSAINLTNATFTSNIRRSPETDAIKLGNTPITFAKSPHFLNCLIRIFNLSSLTTSNILSCDSDNKYW